MKIHQPEMYNNLRPKHVEPVLRENMDIIEDFSWITEDFHNLLDLRITDLRVRDLSRTGDQTVRVFGVTPRLFESAHNQI